MLLGQLELPECVTWSVAVGAPWQHPLGYQRTADVACATASIGKTLLLITVAELMTAGHLDPDRPVSRRSAWPVADSGLWQHLGTDDLSLRDACVLVAAVSDNLATNVLIDLVGLDRVQETAHRLGLTKTGLLDLVRDDRGPHHPPALSVGSALELHRVCSELSSPRSISDEVAGCVTSWLSLDTDLSMVAGAFGLDPLAHAGEDRGFTLWHKTGTNLGVRCDIGVASLGTRKLAWAVLANWDPADASSDPLRDSVLNAMRRIGDAVRHQLEGEAPCK
jgi:beta-lactamase class A